MRSAATRADIVREALSWVGTPFHHCADVKGAGVDCAMLLVRVYVDLGIVPPFDPRPYAPQWFLHHERPIYLEFLARYARQIPIEATLPGDALAMNFGLHAAHGAIVVGSLAIVHAYQPLRLCMRDDRRGLAHRIHSAWSVFA